MKRNLLIVLRTCTRVNMLNGENMGGRYHKVPKHELVNVCLSSLVDSINNCQGHDIKLIVLDDHSSDEAIKDFKTILSQCRYPNEFIPVDGGTGASYTCKKVYELVDKHCTDLWYHAEDDYPHFQSAIQDMLDTVTSFESMTGKMIAVNPHDDVYRYTAQVYPSILLFGPYRHYRTVKHSTYTCLASRAIFDKYRRHFDDAAEWILRKDENDTINQVWNKEDVMLFSPIPSLSLHITLESLKDPYIDFEGLWYSIPHLWKRGDPSKYAIVTMFNEPHFELAKHTWFANKDKYAQRHGYKAFAKMDNFSKEAVHFDKFVHILDTFNKNPELSWIWWLDNDAMITNFNCKIEDVIDDSYDIIMTTDLASLNTGSFMIKNSENSRVWLEDMINKRKDYVNDKKWFDQQCVIDTYISYKEIIKVVPQRTMNSYDYRMYQVNGVDMLGNDGQWQQGDWVIHWPGLNNQLREQLAKQYQVAVVA